MTLSPKLGVIEISTLWHFRLPLLIQVSIKVASSPRLSGIGMPSPIFWSHLLKMQRIVLLSSLLWWELGTNSLITGAGEWLSFRRFTSKLSWSWPNLTGTVRANRPVPSSIKTAALLPGETVYRRQRAILMAAHKPRNGQKPVRLLSTCVKVGDHNGKRKIIRAYNKFMEATWYSVFTRTSVKQ